MLLTLTFFEFLFRFRGVTPCPGGWITASDCSLEILADHIFSANMVPLPGLALNSELSSRRRGGKGGNDDGDGDGDGGGDGGGGRGVKRRWLAQQKAHNPNPNPNPNPNRWLAQDDAAADDDGSSSSGGGSGGFGGSVRVSDDDASRVGGVWSVEGAYLPWGLRVLHYLIPSAAFDPLSPSGLVLNGATLDAASGAYDATYGLPVYTNRFPVLWSDIFVTPDDAAAAAAAAGAGGGGGGGRGWGGGGSSSNPGLAKGAGQLNSSSAIGDAASALLEMAAGMQASGLALLITPLPIPPTTRQADSNPNPSPSPSSNPNTNPNPNPNPNPNNAVDRFLLAQQQDTCLQLAAYNGHLHPYASCQVWTVDSNGRHR